MSADEDGPRESLGRFIMLISVQRGVFISSNRMKEEASETTQARQWGHLTL